VVDPARLRVVLSRLQSRKRELEPYAALDTDGYLASPERVYASRYLLITAIEDALATANHIIASEAYRAPVDYADAFRSLSEAGVLSPELAQRLEAMARFRNLLVHVYAQVDDRKVHEFLAQDLPDLDQFVHAVLDAFPELRESG
jgi:uncharacterized protein YutE (UPF0331/DUF86 family)